MNRIGICRRREDISEGREREVVNHFGARRIGRRGSSDWQIGTILEGGEFV